MHLLDGRDYLGRLSPAELSRLGPEALSDAPAFIAFLRLGSQAEDPGLQRLRQQAIQLLNQVRGELSLHEQVVVPLVAGHYIVTSYLPDSGRRSQVDRGMIGEFTVQDAEPEA